MQGSPSAAADQSGSEAPSPSGQGAGAAAGEKCEHVQDNYAAVIRQLHLEFGMLRQCNAAIANHSVSRKQQQY
jgi:hypothetical protein